MDQPPNPAADDGRQRGAVVAGAAADLQRLGHAAPAAGRDQRGEDAGVDPPVSGVVGRQAVVVEQARRRRHHPGPDPTA